MKKILMLIAGAVLMAGSAWGIPLTLSLDDGNDGSVEVSTSADGFVSFVGAIGVWDINFSAGQSAPFIGTESAPAMDLFSANTSSGAGSMAVRLDGTFSGGLLDPALTSFLTLFGGTTNGTVEISTFIDGVLLSDFGPLGVGAFSGSGSAGFEAPVGDFDLSILAVITHGSGGVSSFDVELVAIPEPATMGLLGIGLVGLAVLGRRRQIQGS